MAVTRLPLVIWYEDGTNVEVTADQRDMAMFEQAAGVGFSKAMDTMTVSCIRMVGYFAARRTGLLGTPPMPRDLWEQKAVEVEAADEEEADPGQPEAGADTSSD